MYEVITGGRSYLVGATEKGVELNGKSKQVSVSELGDGRFHMLLDGKSYSIEVVEGSGKEPIIKVNGTIYSPVVKDETDLLLERLGMNIKAKKEVREMKAPMPGLVRDIRVSVGDTVAEGDAILVLEAMKMENILKSPTNGIIKGISVAVGDAIDKNKLLILFE